MPADFFTQGEVQVFVKPRWYNQWAFLGTALSSPQVRTQYVYRDIQSERVQPGAFNKMLQTERHVVAAVLNRINHRTLNRIRSVGVAGADGGPSLRRIESGRLVVGSTDFELFIRYALPNEVGGPAPPDGASKGRLYYSAVLLDLDEDAPSRVQEVALLIECNPLPKDHMLLLFSEREEDFPAVTPE